MPTRAQFIGYIFIAVISIFAVKDAIKDKSSGPSAPAEEPARTSTVISGSSFFDFFSVTVKHPFKSWVYSKSVGADGKVGRLEVVLEKDSQLEHKENKNCHLDIVDSELKAVGNQDVYLAGVKNRLEVLNNVEGLIAGDGNSGEISQNRIFRMELNQMKDIKIIGNTNADIHSNGGTITAENNANLVILGSDHNLEVCGTKNLQIRKSSNGKNEIEIKSVTYVALMDLRTQAYRNGEDERDRRLREYSLVNVLKSEDFNLGSDWNGYLHQGFEKSVWTEKLGRLSIAVEYANSASINGNSFAIGEFAFTVTPVDDDNLDIVLLQFNQNIIVKFFPPWYVVIGIEGAEGSLKVAGLKVKISEKNPSEIRIIL